MTRSQCTRRVGFWNILVCEEAIEKNSLQFANGNKGHSNRNASLWRSPVELICNFCPHCHSVVYQEGCH